jgi:hypothetical protein
MFFAGCCPLTRLLISLRPDRISAAAMMGCRFCIRVQLSWYNPPLNVVHCVGSFRRAEIVAKNLIPVGKGTDL